MCRAVLGGVQWRPGVKPAPNKGLELTASSVRSYLASASGSSSGLALDARGVRKKPQEYPEDRV